MCGGARTACEVGDARALLADTRREPPQRGACSTRRRRIASAMTSPMTTPPSHAHGRRGGGARSGTRTSGSPTTVNPAHSLAGAPRRMAASLASRNASATGAPRGERVVQVAHQAHRAPVADPPLGGDHRPRARLEQRRREPLQSFARDHHPTRRAAGRQHHQVGVELERRQVRRREEAILARAGRQRERGAGERVLVHQRVGGEVDHPEPVDRRALEPRFAGVAPEPDLRAGGVARHVAGFVAARGEARQTRRWRRTRRERARPRGCRPAARSAGERRVAQREEAWAHRLVADATVRRSTVATAADGASPIAQRSTASRPSGSRSASNATRWSGPSGTTIEPGHAGRHRLGRRPEHRRAEALAPAPRPPRRSRAAPRSARPAAPASPPAAAAAPRRRRA